MIRKDEDSKRMSIYLPPELVQAVVEMRKTDEFCRCSYAEIIRYLMVQGLERVNAQG